jgi:hypothetical protein
VALRPAARTAGAVGDRHAGSGDTERGLPRARTHHPGQDVEGGDLAGLSTESIGAVAALQPDEQVRKHDRDDHDAREEKKVDDQHHRPSPGPIPASV